MNKFYVYTSEGLNKPNGYVIEIGSYQNEDSVYNIYDFDCSSYDMDHVIAYKLGDNCLVLDEDRYKWLLEKEKKEDIENEIAQLEQQLKDTDYIWNVIKEGDHDESYYADIIANRHTWRMRIRELEGK